MITGALRNRFTGLQEVLAAIDELLELVDIADEQLLLAGKVKTEREWVSERIDNGFNASELMDLAGHDEHARMLGRKLPIASDEDHVTVGPEGGERIKDWEELRHTLAHLWNAIDHLVDGFPESAGAELQDCLDPIFWNSTDEMRTDLDGRTQRRADAVPPKETQRPEEEGQQAQPETIAEAFNLWWGTFPEGVHGHDKTAMFIAFKGGREQGGRHREKYENRSRATTRPATTA